MEHRIVYLACWFAAGTLASMMGAVVISVQASERAIRSSERRQCEAYAAEVRGYRELPPSTPAGQNQLRTKVELLKLWGCPIPPEGK